MYGSYRSIFIALVAFLFLCGASPNGQRNDSNEVGSEPEAADSLRRIANALDQVNESNRNVPNCKPGSEDRRSDLCAQWKAADAAQQAADAADETVTIGWIGLALGAITMAAAIAAAVFAKRAADGASEANVISRATAERAERDAARARQALVRAERAIVRIRSIVAEPPPFETSEGAMVSIEIYNMGRTNATDFEVYYGLRDAALYPPSKLYKLISNDICIPSDRLTLPAFKIRKRSSYPAYLMGYIEYAAAHGERFKTFFCRRIEGMPRRGQLGDFEYTNLQDNFCQKLPKDS